MSCKQLAELVREPENEEQEIDNITSLFGKVLLSDYDKFAIKGTEPETFADSEPVEVDDLPFEATLVKIAVNAEKLDEIMQKAADVIAASLEEVGKAMRDATQRIPEGLQDGFDYEWRTGPVPNCRCSICLATLADEPVLVRTMDVAGLCTPSRASRLTDGPSYLRKMLDYSRLGITFVMGEDPEKADISGFPNAGTPVINIEEAPEVRAPIDDVIPIPKRPPPCTQSIKK